MHRRAVAFPRSMQMLPPQVQFKASDMVDMMLDAGIDEYKAIRIAIVAAKSWGNADGEPLSVKAARSAGTDED